MKYRRLDFPSFKAGGSLSLEHTKLWNEALSRLEAHSIERLEDVKSIAVERDVSFYDASYVWLAEERNLSLVTEDEELLKVCRKA